MTNIRITNNTTTHSICRYLALIIFFSLNISFSLFTFIIMNRSILVQGKLHKLSKIRDKKGAVKEPPKNDARLCKDVRYDVGTGCCVNLRFHKIIFF